MEVFGKYFATIHKVETITIFLDSEKSDASKKTQESIEMS